MNPGDYIEIKTSSETIKGILMPDSINERLVLKLDSGYNMGIDKSKIKSTKIIKKKIKKNTKKIKTKVQKKLPKILILHTGGTIASQVDYASGGVISRFTSEDILNLYPELRNIANIETKQLFNIFSEDLSFKEYNIIAKEIKKAKGIEGIIITHGTDTMHYTSAALSFMLDNLGIPILLVGSQRSSDRGSSDAFLNLVCATQFIIKSNFAGVGVCMHSSIDDNRCYILQGLKLKKLHSSRRDAFQPINTKPIASVSPEGKINIIQGDFQRKEKKTIKVSYFNENLKIGILKSHPNMHYSELSNYHNFDGLIIEGTGLGHLPINSNSRMFTELKKLKIPIIMTTQTIFGRTNLNVYSTGRKLKDYVLPASDMTPETAFIKLAWVLSNKKEIDLMLSNLKGEINERISNEFLQKY